MSLSAHPRPVPFPLAGAKCLAGVAGALLLAACSSISGQYPRNTPLLPDAAIRLTPSTAVSLEQVAVVAGAATVLYLVYDPLAPNWKIEERALSGDTYTLSMRAKSFRTGGDGESLQILKRRALALQRERGYTSYRILDYSEGVESSTPFTHRFSEGTVQLVRADSTPVQP